MAIINYVSGVFKRVSKIFGWTGAQVECSDCPRVNSCGLPPSENCISRVELLQRYHQVGPMPRCRLASEWIKSARD